MTINIKYFSGQCPKSPFLAPISLRCSGERWEGKATVPSAFLPANVSAFNMFAIHKATLIEEDQVSCVVVCQNAEFPNQLRLKIISLCVSDLICRALPIISFQKFIDKSFYFEAWEDGKIYEALFPVEEVRHLLFKDRDHCERKHLLFK